MSERTFQVGDLVAPAARRGKVIEVESVAIGRTMQPNGRYDYREVYVCVVEWEDGHIDRHPERELRRG